MTEKRTIDPKHYGVAGYRNIPSYSLPYKATGHLLYHDDGTALCGVAGVSRHDRKVPNARAIDSPWAKICADCRRVAERDHLEEWVMPPLKKGDCPVLSERVGKPHKHIILPHRPRCKNCPEPKWNRHERCSARHRTYAMCRDCGWKDEDHHYCDETVGRSMGISTDFGYCNRRAYEQRHVPDRYHQPDGMVWHYLCKQHLPEAVQARKDASDAKYRAWSADLDAKEAARQSRRDAFDIAVEMARWIAKNRDLAEEDEWLGQIAVKVAGNTALTDALGEGDAQG